VQTLVIDLLVGKYIEIERGEEILNSTDGYSLKLVGKLGMSRAIHEFKDAKVAVCLTGTE
jgi:hypothetical protein